MVKTTKGSEKKAHYSLAKQSSRNDAKRYAQSVGSAYENNMREHERNDYIK